MSDTPIHDELTAYARLIEQTQDIDTLDELLRNKSTYMPLATAKQHTSPARHVVRMLNERILTRATCLYARMLEGAKPPNPSTQPPQDTDGIYHRGQLLCAVQPSKAADSAAFEAWSAEFSDRLKRYDPACARYTTKHIVGRVMHADAVRLYLPADANHQVAVGIIAHYGLPNPLTVTEWGPQAREHVAQGTP